MELGIQLRYVDEIEVARVAERAGFAKVCVGDNMTDAFTMVGAFAGVTERVELHTSVVTWTRTPVTTALAATTAAELTGGRFALGIGAMPKHWSEDFHGVPYERIVGRMREYVAAIRAAWSAAPDRPVDFDGEFYSFRRYAPLAPPTRHRIPITLGVIRPMMTRLAGEVADGVCLDSMHTVAWTRDVLLPKIDEGLARAGRRRDELSIGAAVICAVADDAAEARALARRTVAFYLLTPYLRDVLAHHGFGADYDRGAAALARGDVDGAAAAMHDEIVDTIAVVGTPEQVRDQLRDRYARLVDWVRLSPPHGNPTPVVREQGLRLIDAAAALVV
jgi:probable F420-dependent oxidoreductase